MLSSKPVDKSKAQAFGSSTLQQEKSRQLSLDTSMTLTRQSQLGCYCHITHRKVTAAAANSEQFEAAVAAVAPT
jgi:hypothetical protein